jgi:hypothetical protein
LYSFKESEIFYISLLEIWRQAIGGTEFVFRQVGRRIQCKIIASDGQKELHMK